MTLNKGPRGCQSGSYRGISVIIADLGRVAGSTIARDRHFGLRSPRFIRFSSWVRLKCNLNVEKWTHCDWLRFVGPGLEVVQDVMHNGAIGRH